MVNIKLSHFSVSMVKSVLRIIGCVFLASGGLFLAAAFLAVAEFLGIYEEIV